MQDDFFQADFEQPHPDRTRAILKAHPEVRTLVGRNPWTALIGLLVVAVQSAIAFAVSRLGPNGWWVGLFVAYGFGAFANHCTYVIIHDATHNLVFRSRMLNKPKCPASTMLDWLTGSKPRPWSSTSICKRLFVFRKERIA